MKNRTDQIRAELARIHSELDHQARADRCRGDICCGWDWPTLCIVKPDVAGRIQALKREGRSLVTVGL